MKIVQSVLISRIHGLLELMTGQAVERKVKDGIVYLTFPDGSYIDFTAPIHHPPAEPNGELAESDSEIKERLRYEQRTKDRPVEGDDIDELTRCGKD